MGYDRKNTEARLIEAVGRLLVTHGFSSMGVNAIAREAGVNKSLIYRYFSDLDGLYTAFAESESVWPPLEEILKDVPARLPKLSARDAITEVLMNYAAALRQRPITIDILAWECAERNALTIAFETVREQWSQSIFAALVDGGIEPNPRLVGAITMITSAIHYLAIRSRSIKVFNGLQVGSEEFWQEGLPEFINAMLVDVV